MATAISHPHHLLLHLHLLLFITIVSFFSTSAATGHHTGITFIHASCKSTRYPAICNRCLSAYAPTIHRNPCKLARAALSVSLRHARSACTYVDRVAGTGSGQNAVRSRAAASAVLDCIETMSDSVEYIRDSIREMGHMGRKGSPTFWYHVSNVQSWVSAALTDEGTCDDSFRSAAGGGMDAGVRASIRRRIVKVAQVTSNALALVNKLAKGRF